MSGMSSTGDREKLLLNSSFNAMAEPSTPQAAKEEQATGKFWLLASFAASILFTASAVIRGVLSENWLVTKGLLSIVYFSAGLLYIVLTKLYRAYKGDPTPLCWSQPDRDADGAVVEGPIVYAKSIFGVLMLRGVFEFAGNTLLLLALKISLDNSMNQGISTAMMSLAGLLITLMSWCI